MWVSLAAECVYVHCAVHRERERVLVRSHQINVAKSHQNPTYPLKNTSSTDRERERETNLGIDN